ncbi:MAG: LLM class F420-dependent oxidoreductase [Deltaproteobacteria bacterium]|nr:MAG: LLM class F420-dependent oxidoreductase [Deltaproteobacteria bacterium]
MRFWQAVSLTEPDQLLEIARGAEEAGFHGVLLSDHLFFPEKLASKYPYTADGVPGFDAHTPWPEPWTTIAAMAAVTRRLHFATMVYILPLRNPLEVAKATGTVAVLSGNRLALGAGAGWMKEEFDALGVDFRTRGKRFDEMIEVLRTLWRGGMADHHGAFFDFDRIQMSPAPTRPIPIYIGGTSGAALRRAARLGDGWIGPGNDPAEVPGILERLSTLRREAGRASQPFETIVPLAGAFDPDTLRRLEGQGMTATIHYPFAYVLGPSSTLDEKRAAMRRFAEEVIAPTNAG